MQEKQANKCVTFASLAEARLCGMQEVTKDVFQGEPQA